MKKLNKRAQSGYTIVELIIAIQLMMIVLTMGYSIYLFGHRYVSGWQERNDLIRTQLYLNKVLSEEFRNCYRIIDLNEKSITYEGRAHQIRRMFWSNDSLFLNNKLLNRKGIRIKLQKMQIYKYSGLDLGSDSGIEMRDNLIPLSESYQLNDVDGIEIVMTLQSKHFERNITVFQALSKTNDLND